MYYFQKVTLFLVLWDLGNKSSAFPLSMGLVILHCMVWDTWSPLMLVSDNLSVTFLGLAGDIYKPDTYRRTQGFAELHLECGETI